MGERCQICGCEVHRRGDYAQPTVKGRSHASKHHYVAERFFGRSTNRRGEIRKGLPLGERLTAHEGKWGVFCYECHEELLHNPVLLPDDVELFARIVRRLGAHEARKTADRRNVAKRIAILHRAISLGLEAIEREHRRR